MANLFSNTFKRAKEDAEMAQEDRPQTLTNLKSEDVGYIAAGFKVY